MSDDRDRRTTRAIILERRKFFIASALAGLGLGAAACEKSQPQPCLSEPMVCLSPPQLPEQDGGTDAGAAQTAPSDAGVDDGGSVIATDPDGGVPDPKAHPPEQLQPKPKPTPKVCLRVAPPTPDKQQKG